MLLHELRQLAARHVPGTGQLDIQRMGGGLVNETYRVLRGGVTFALRVAAGNPYGLGVDRGWEVRVLQQAAAADLAPAVEYFDPDRGTLITRWEAGLSWGAEAARRPANISRMAALMRRIHALPAPLPARLMSPAKWIDYYSVADRDGAGDGEELAAALRPAASRQLAALARLPAAAAVLCHSDLHSLNLIDRGASLILLDWEYAHVSDPLWDLAGWSANNDFEESLTADLLQSYLGRPPTDDEYLRLRLLGWLYDYVCLLWSELYLYLDRDRRPGAQGHGVAAGQGTASGPDQPGGVASRAQLLRARLMHRSSLAP